MWNDIPASEVHKTLRKVMLADGLSLVFDIDKSHGTFCHDATTGREYLDFFSMFATSPVGYNHPRLRNDETIRRLGEIAVTNVTNSDFYTREMAWFVDLFSRLAKPEYMTHLFLIAGGALGIENALKAAFDWKVRQNFRRGYRYECGHQVLHFDDAFHGRTGYTISMTNTFIQNKVKYFTKFKWPRVVNPKITFPLEGDNLDRVIEAEKLAISQIYCHEAENPDDIAALIIEPIQGEGGDNHFRPEFFQELRRVCDELEIMFILDEVQTGVGLTGKMWAYEHFGIKPDMFAFGKKLQVCGFLAGTKIDEEQENVFRVNTRLNSTWGGNLIDMIRGGIYLKIIQEENLIDNAARLGEKLRAGLQTLQEEFPDILSNARGRGLMCAVDFPDSETRDKVRANIYKNGALIPPCGKSTMRFRPPLNVTAQEIDQGIEIIRKSVKEYLS
jgi:L-lysine 6-transaminase